jgi:hypothetical protein
MDEEGQWLKTLIPERLTRPAFFTAGDVSPAVEFCGQARLSVFQLTAPQTRYNCELMG